MGGSDCVLSMLTMLNSMEQPAGGPYLLCLLAAAILLLLNLITIKHAGEYLLDNGIVKTKYNLADDAHIGTA
jgi:hypothetical protein